MKCILYYRAKKLFKPDKLLFVQIKLRNLFRRFKTLATQYKNLHDEIIFCKGGDKNWSEEASGKSL